MLTRTELAAVCRFIACLLAGEDEIAPTQTGEPAAPVKRRGRPPGNTAAPVTPEPGTPAAPDPAPPSNSPEKPAAKPIKGKTLEELRELINPIVKVPGQGIKVKAILNKYKHEGFPADTDYMLSELVNHPEHHAAFVKDIEGLSF